jgi:hypothetical protein
MNKSQEKSLTEKKYFLDKTETVNINSRQELIKQYQYLIHVINMDIQSYVHFQILKRLSIPEDKNYILSQDNTYITLPGGEDASTTKE